MVIFIGYDGCEKNWPFLSIVQYIFKLIYPNEEIIIDNRPECKIFIKSVDPSKGYFKNKKLPYICWSGEPFEVIKENYEPICNIVTTDIYSGKPNYFYLPQIAVTYYSRNLKFPNIRQFNNSYKPFLVAYCSSRHVWIRDTLFNILRKKNSLVHGLGKCNNTLGKLLKGGHCNPELIKTYSNYKFVFAMENQIKKGYLTEKIINAYVSGSVPIYWGDSVSIKKIFNPESFICVNDFETLEECANHIINIAEDDIKYSKMIEANIFVDNKIPDFFIQDYENPSSIYSNIANLIKKNFV